jgi:TonB family protein
MMKNRWFTASLIIHLTCLIIFICRLNSQMPREMVVQTALTSYLTSLPQEVTQVSRATPRPITAQQLASHPQPTPNSKPVPELVAMLHAAIEQTQRYPASAEEMEREGRTTLAFTLFSNGSIQNLKILSSSGTQSLDYAALAAVNEAVPFQQVGRYLQGAQDYQVDVVFKLH